MSCPDTSLPVSCLSPHLYLLSAFKKLSFQINPDSLDIVFLICLSPALSSSSCCLVLCLFLRVSTTSFCLVCMSVRFMSGFFMHAQMPACLPDASMPARCQHACQMPACLPDASMPARCQHACQMPACLPDASMPARCQHACQMPACMPDASMHARCQHACQMPACMPDFSTVSAWGPQRQKPN